MMTNQKDFSIQNLKENIDDIAASVNKSSDMLDQFFDLLGQRDIGPPAFLRKTLQRMVHDVETLKNSSGLVVTEIERSQELVRTLNYITSSLELDHVLEKVLDSVVSLTGAERAYLMLYDEQGSLEIRAARNWSKETINDLEAEYSRSVVNAAIKEKKAIITDNAQTDERFDGAHSILVQQLRSIICIPLTIHGETVGILYADNRFQQGIFNPKDLPLLTAFGTQAAISIKNAKKYGVVREGLEEAEREIVRLKIEIDEAKRQKEVEEIVDSESFEELRKRAQKIRQRRKQTK
jgi:GAF domain-containing protein